MFSTPGTFLQLYFSSKLQLSPIFLSSKMGKGHHHRWFLWNQLFNNSQLSGCNFIKMHLSVLNLLS